MQLVYTIIIFLILSFLFIEGLRLFSLSEKEWLIEKNKSILKQLQPSYFIGKILSLFYIILSISLIEKVLFYPLVDIILSLKISAILILIYLIVLFVKKIK